MCTQVCELLGIDWPIVQAPIGSAADARLAAAVSNAGALGMVALTWVVDVGSVVHGTAALTKLPFGGNLVLEWDQHRRLEEALEAGLRIVSFTWGDPAPYVERVHRAGALVVHTVGSAEEARRAADCGVDVIVGWPDAPHRAIRNSTAEAWEISGRPPPGARPGEGEAVARLASGEPLVRYSSATALEGTTGDVEALSLWAGQSVALAKRIQPAAAIIAELTARL